MSQSFDPYYKWLGIPPEEQPPHHYRLLGITVFETDPDVIESAADQRMAHLRVYQTGKNADLSQRLLNEVAAARVCLLNPEKRTAYDEQLKTALSATSTTSATSNFTFPEMDEPWVTRPTSIRRARRQPVRNLGPMIGAALAVGLAAIAVLAWQIASQKASSPASLPVQKPAVQPQQIDKGANSKAPAPREEHRQSAQAVAPAKKPTASISDRNAITPPKQVVEEALPREPVAETPLPKSKAVLKLGPDVAEPVARKSETPVGAVPLKERPGDARESPRVAVPSAAEQEAAMKVVHDVYQFELAKAKTPQTRETLANTLLDKAKQQAAGDVAGTFVLLRLARELAVQAANDVIAFQAIDLMAERFEIDAVAMKKDAIAELAKKARDPLEHLAIARRALELTDEAELSGNFAEAAQLNKLATAEGTKARDRDIVLLARNRLKDIQAAVKMTADFEAARAKLADEPDDPNANTIAASYYCFLRNDWKKGLPFLAKARDPAIRTLAQRELQEAPTDPVDRVKLADAWWDFAQKADGKRKERVLLHAGLWYMKALLSLPDGMVKLKVEKRIEEIEKLDPRWAPRLSPLM